jgi:hypothetical protein
VYTRAQVIEQLKVDSDAFAEDLRQKEIARARALEEAAQREIEVAGVQKSIAELESKLRNQQVHHQHAYTNTHQHTHASHTSNYICVTHAFKFTNHCVCIVVILPSSVRICWTRCAQTATRITSS